MRSRQPRLPRAGYHDEALRQSNTNQHVSHAMTSLVAGLLIFLGVHSVRIVADGWRTAQIARLGERSWRGLYSLVSLAGLVLIVWGFGQARLSPVVVWDPPAWAPKLTTLLSLPAFILIVAGNLPATKLKAALGHPMLLGTLLWAFAHLIGNGRLAGVVLFGAFVAWAIVGYVSKRRRDAAAGVVYPKGAWPRDLLAAAIGAVVWFAFGFWMHGPLIGLRPFA
jgi:uncharacterized membrane protein